MRDDPATPALPARREAARRVALGLGGALLLPRFASGPAHAAPPRDLKVITGTDSPSARQLLQLLRQRHPGLVADANPAPPDARHTGPPPVHVAMGAAALQKALAADLKGPVIALMVSSQAFRQMLGVDQPGYKDRPHITASFADASPAAQMQLIQALFGGRTVVGALLSDASAYLDKPLRLAAAMAGLTLQIERIAPGVEAARALTRLRDAQVLLAVPDGTLYTPDTLRSVLEATYRRAMPVIGFSAATVTAGTLATAYCALEDMAADALALIDEIGNGAQPEARHPASWRVAVNDSVARSLGISIDDKVRQLGQPHGTGRGT